jgi:hydroxymethylglutaryl-CoA reductase
MTMTRKAERNSRLSGFYRLTPAERLQALVRAGFLTDEQAGLLGASGSLIGIDTANTMIENVIGVFELPIGVGLNFVVNGRDYVVPMVVEEPSIVAAVSHVARIVRDAGGFEVDVDDPVMIGQIQVVGLSDLAAAAAAVEQARDELLALANAREPGMQRRGGGAVGIEVRPLPYGDAPDRRRDMLVVHLLVDCRDAMGANLINTMAEALAPRIEELTGGNVFLRILSNLTDRRRVRARCAIPVEQLAWKDFTGEQVADGVVRASEFAERDPYRAATHNKGIMNGIDAVALATGQDWRAIEAGAHAWVGRDKGYKPMAVWRCEGGVLRGELDIPMAVGIVGGPIRLHPTVQALLAMLDVSTSGELAAILGAVGLAQNLGAIKALGTTGIQRGHMALHARSVAATAGATGELVDRVAEALIASGNIKVDQAKVFLAEYAARTAQ